MYTNKELQNKVIDSVNTILCLNPKEAIRMLRGGKVVDFNYLKNNLSISLPLDLESPAAKECLSNCIFNPSAAFVSFVEFMNFEYDDEYIRSVYHCFFERYRSRVLFLCCNI